MRRFFGMYKKKGWGCIKEEMRKLQTQPKGAYLEKL
jgi:hypothetical protein